jgi:hypothetical protein
MNEKEYGDSLCYCLHKRREHNNWAGFCLTEVNKEQCACRGFRERPKGEL